MATFTITVDSQTNQPPSSVGDGEETTDYGVSIVYTRAMFTTNTVPVYTDPEGNPAFKLKVTSLPETGELQYNSTAVTINQIILFSDIDLGLLTYIPDSVTTTAYVADFLFEITDEFSGIFVG